MIKLHWQKQALIAKSHGYEYMSSVVKSVFSTTYYHVERCDDVIAYGWKGCSKGSFAAKNGGSWHGRAGVSKRPAKCVARNHGLKEVTA